ncbi:MAG: hypothetical protein JW806_07055 [Sedimentisphaerales bacterium]|nr:hypothetical protein [Sedimentisphaerales bacterium]
MQTVKKTGCLLLLIITVFLGSCNQNRKDNPFGISPINQILKIHPSKITIAIWNSPSEVGMTDQLFIEAVKNPENWIVELEISDANQINMIMVALAKPPAEPYSSYMLPMAYKISFEDKNGRIKWTSLNILRPDEKVFLSDIIYGKETYDVFAKILNIKPM